MTIERIQNRRGTTAAWGAANPVLFLGEFGVELTTSGDVKVKVGDGEASWDDLPYISSEVNLSAYYTSTQTNSAITSAITSATATINTALSGKSNTDHTHTLDNLSDVSSSTATNGQYLRFNGTSWVAGAADAPSSVSYDDLTDVPTEFPPEDHTHTISDITGITATATEINLLDGVLATTTEINYLDGVTSNIQDQISGRAPLSHTHAIADTTGLQTALDAKAASSHTHTKSQITDFSHTHVMSDITDLSVDVSELTNTLLISPKEKTLVSATAATGTINVDVSSQSDVFYTSNATANFTLNIRGNASTTLSSLLSVGQSVTVVFKNTNGSTPYYLTTVQIDGTTVTPKWLISAPSYGTPSGIDSYNLTITKTGSSTFVVFGSQAGYV
jgi:hypothetical protein